MNIDPYNAPAHTAAPSPDAGTTITSGPLDLAVIAVWSKQNARTRRIYHQEQRRLDLREWARANGHRVAKNGSVSLETQRAHDAAVAS